MWEAMINPLKNSLRMMEKTKTASGKDDKKMLRQKHPPAKALYGFACPWPQKSH